jgi:hypothetical protein
VLGGPRGQGSSLRVRYAISLPFTWRWQMKQLQSTLVIGGLLLSIASSASAIVSVCDGSHLTIDCETHPPRTVKCYDGSYFNGVWVRYQVDCCADTDCMNRVCSGTLGITGSCNYDSTHLGVCCASGDVLGCFNTPPARTLSCPATPNLAGLTDCQYDSTQQENACAAITTQTVPTVSIASQALLVLLLGGSGICVILFRLKRSASRA